VIQVIAHKSDNVQIMNLKAAFDAYDKSHNGTLDFEEFKEAMKDSHCSDLSEYEIEEMFSSIDFGGNGQILYTEFLAATIEARGQIEESRIAEAFRRIDADNSGTITKQEIQTLVGRDCTPEQIDEIMMNADTDGDGVISYDEFVEAFREQNQAFKKRISFSDSFGLNDLSFISLDYQIPGGRWDSE